MLIFPGQWFGQTLQYISALFKGKLFGMKVKRVIQLRDLKYSIPIALLAISLQIVLPFYINGSEFLPSLLAYIITFNVGYWIVVFPNHDTLLSHDETVHSDWGIQQVKSSLSFKQPLWLSQFLVE